MKITLHPFVRAATLLSLILSLAGCAGVEQARKTTNDIRVRAESSVQVTPEARPVVAVHDKETPWLTGEALRPATPSPAIMGHETSYKVLDDNGNPAIVSLTDIASWIVKNVGVRVEIDSSAQVLQNTSIKTPGVASATSPVATGVPVPIAGAASSPMTSASGLSKTATGQIMTPLGSYKGTLKGFLDLVDAHFSVWSRYRDGTITFFKTETVTYTLPSFPTTSNMTGSISTGSTNGGASSAASTGTSSSSSNGSGLGQTSMSTTVKVDYWAKLQETASAVAGPGAIVVADGNFGTLTVTGTPPQVQRLGDWVKDISAMLSKQIAIDVHVYNVQRTREDNYGMTLSAAFNSSGGHTGVSLTSASTPTITSSSSPMSFGANILSGPLSGTSLAVQALSTLGDVTQEVSRAGVTPNGQMLALQTADNLTYLYSSASTTTANVGTTSTLVPGTLTLGFTGSFLPRVVEGGNILVNINMTLSNLVELTTYTSGSTGSTSSLQEPHWQSSTFQQSVLLKSGQSLVLTGYRLKNSSVNKNGVGTPENHLLGGGVDAQTGDTLLAVVVTARLL